MFKDIINKGLENIKQQEEADKISREKKLQTMTENRKEIEKLIQDIIFPVFLEMERELKETNEFNSVEIENGKEIASNSLKISIKIEYRRRHMLLGYNFSEEAKSATVKKMYSDGEMVSSIEFNDVTKELVQQDCKELLNRIFS